MCPPDRIEQDLKKSRRDGTLLAILFIDLDRFKEVNDTLGHDKGDLLLVEAARRIRECVRESDTVARLGATELTVALADLEDTSRIQYIGADDHRLAGGRVHSRQRKGVRHGQHRHHALSRRRHGDP